MLICDKPSPHDAAIFLAGCLSSAANPPANFPIAVEPRQLDGLKAMGFEDRASIFQKSLDYFGSHGPSSDRKTRQTQLSKIYQKHEADLNKLDSQYYDSKESIEVGLIRFVIHNAPKFQ